MSALLILSAFANLFAGVVLAYAIVCRLNDRAEIRRLRDSLGALLALDVLLIRFSMSCHD